MTTRSTISINKHTRKRTHMNDMKHGDDYLCLACNTGVICVCPEIAATHIRHLPNQASYNCPFYDNNNSYNQTKMAVMDDCPEHLMVGGESEYHKMAKNMIADVINGTFDFKMRFEKRCNCGKKLHKTITQDSNYKAVVEHHFQYNVCDRWADIALIDSSGKMKYIIEVMYSHRTDPANRPGKWSEVKATDVIESMRLEESNNFHFICKRHYKCVDCIDRVKKAKEYNIRKQEYEKKRKEIAEKREYEINNAKKILFTFYAKYVNIHYKSNRVIRFNRRMVYHELKDVVYKILEKIESVERKREYEIHTRLLDEKNKKYLQEEKQRLINKKMDIYINDGRDIIRYSDIRGWMYDPFHKRIVNEICDFLRYDSYDEFISHIKDRDVIADVMKRIDIRIRFVICNGISTQLICNTLAYYNHK